MLAFPSIQEHPESNVVASLPGVPSHPSQLSQYKAQGQHLNESGSGANTEANTEANRKSILVNTNYKKGKQETNKTMDKSSQQYNMMDETQVDIASAKGIFGWAVVDRTNVPYIIREKKRYVSVRMVEMKLLSRYPSTYPDELKDKPPLMSQYITPAEAKLLNEINFEHCAGEFGNSEFNAKDLIVSLEDFEEFYNVVRKHFPDELLESYAKGNHRTSAEGGWVQVNNTVVPYVLRAGVKLVPLSVIRYAAGLLGNVKVHGIEPAEEECVYLNKSCESAGLDFKFAKSTKMIELKLVPNLSKTKVNIVELPKYDPFGSAEYQDLPEEEEKSVQMGASLPVNMPVMPQAGMPYIPGPPALGMPPGARISLHQQRGMVAQRMPYDNVPQLPTGQPPLGSSWMNPHIGVYPGYPGMSPGSQMVTGQNPFRPMGPPAFTATQSSPAGTMPPGYISPEGALQPNQQNHHALQNLQHMTKMAELQMGRNKRRKSNDGRSSLMNNTSVSPNQTPPPYALDSYRNQPRGSAHLSPPQHHGLQSQLSPRLPLGHMPPHPMMEGVPNMNGMPQPGMMMHGMGPPQHGRPNHPQMQRMPGLQHAWQQMPRNQAEYQEMMKQMSSDMTKNTGSSSKRGSMMRSQPPVVNIAHLEGDKMPSLSGIGNNLDTRNSRSPVVSLQKDGPTSINNQPRERGRIKSTPTRRSPSISAPSVPTPPPQPIIKTMEFHNKTISCIIKNGEFYALVEAISRVYFPYCSLQDFQFALEKVLQVRITQLDRNEEEIYIKFYGLPTKSLKCTKCVHLKDFDEYMPQLKYMFKDKEQEGHTKQKEVTTDVSVAQWKPSPQQLKASGDTNNNAKYYGEGKKSVGARSETFNVLKTFLGKRSADSSLANPTASKVAKGFASRLEDAVNRLKKKNNLQENDGASVNSPNCQSSAEICQTECLPGTSMECSVKANESSCDLPIKSTPESCGLNANMQTISQKSVNETGTSSFESSQKGSLCGHLVTETASTSDKPNAITNEGSTESMSIYTKETSRGHQEISMPTASEEVMTLNMLNVSNESKAPSLQESSSEPKEVILPKAVEMKLPEQRKKDPVVPTEEIPFHTTTDSSLNVSSGTGEDSIELKLQITKSIDLTEKSTVEGLSENKEEACLSDALDGPNPSNILATRETEESLPTEVKQHTKESLCEEPLGPSEIGQSDNLTDVAISMSKAAPVSTAVILPETNDELSTVMSSKEVHKAVEESLSLDNSNELHTVNFVEASEKTKTDSVSHKSEESTADSLIQVPSATKQELLPGVLNDEPMSVDETCSESTAVLTRGSMIETNEVWALSSMMGSDEKPTDALLSETKEPNTQSLLESWNSQNVPEASRDVSSADSLPVDTEDASGMLKGVCGNEIETSMPVKVLEPLVDCSLNRTSVLAAEPVPEVNDALSVPREFIKPTVEIMPEVTNEPISVCIPETNDKGKIGDSSSSFSEIATDSLIMPSGIASKTQYSMSITDAQDTSVRVPVVINTSTAICQTLPSTAANSIEIDNNCKPATENEATNESLIPRNITDGESVQFQTEDNAHETEEVSVVESMLTTEAAVLDLSGIPSSGSLPVLSGSCVEESLPDLSGGTTEQKIKEDSGHLLESLAPEISCYPTLSNEAEKSNYEQCNSDKVHSEKENREQFNCYDSHQNFKDIPKESNIGKNAEHADDVPLIHGDNNVISDAGTSVATEVEDETKTIIVTDGKDGSVVLCFD